MQSMNRQQKSPIRSRGFTLLEVLISIIIIAIGLLGMAGLQVTTLRNNNSSSMRTQATFLAEDMADRMRSNMAGVTAGNYATTPSCASTGCTITTGCAPNTLAAYDICEWQNNLDVQNINSGLPLGTGQITSLLNGIFQIRVMWDDARTGATGTNCSGNTAVDLTCFDLEFRP